VIDSKYARICTLRGIIPHKIFVTSFLIISSSPLSFCLFLKYILETDLITLFSYFNGVTDIYNLLYFYQIEIQIYFLMFDPFVDEILVVMKSYVDTTNQQNEGTLIVDSLENC
jgi:hypothetical protein